MGLSVTYYVIGRTNHDLSFTSHDTLVCCTPEGDQTLIALSEGSPLLRMNDFLSPTGPRLSTFRRRERWDTGGVGREKT